MPTPSYKNEQTAWEVSQKSPPGGGNHYAPLEIIFALGFELALTKMNKPRGRCLKNCPPGREPLCSFGGHFRSWFQLACRHPLIKMNKPRGRCAKSVSEVAFPEPPTPVCGGHKSVVKPKVLSRKLHPSHAEWWFLKKEAFEPVLLPSKIDVLRRRGAKKIKLARNQLQSFI